MIIRVIYRTVFFLLAVLVTGISVHAQGLSKKQVIASIAETINGMKECHIQIHSTVFVGKKTLSTEAYEVYKKNPEFYVKYRQAELLFTSSVLVMVIHQEKQIVIRPVTDKEAKKMKNKLNAVIDSTNFKNSDSARFSETDNYYEFTRFSDRDEIRKTIYYFNKKTFLMEKIEYFYRKKNQKEEDRKAIVEYIYDKTPFSEEYFNISKYIVRNSKGIYVPSRAFSNYTININDPYEK